MKAGTYTKTKPDTPTYDDSLIEYDETDMPFAHREEETEIPTAGKIVEEAPEKGKVIGKTGVKLFADIITYNEETVDYNDGDTYYGAEEIESEKPSKGEIITKG